MLQTTDYYPPVPLPRCLSTASVATSRSSNVPLKAGFTPAEETEVQLNSEFSTSPTYIRLHPHCCSSSLLLLLLLLLSLSSESPRPSHNASSPFARADISCATSRRSN